MSVELRFQRGADTIIGFSYTYYFVVQLLAQKSSLFISPTDWCGEKHHYNRLINIVNNTKKTIEVFVQSNDVSKRQLTMKLAKQVFANTYIEWLFDVSLNFYYLN